MQKILASVGRGGKNNDSDVKVVQQLLNKHRIPRHTTPLRIDGLVGSKTITRIEAFQKSIVKMIPPDGRVDPNGKTIAVLLINTGKSARMYHMSAKGKELLKSIEQLRLKPYDDQTGKEITSWVKGATIGYGHLIRKGEWNTYENGINNTQAEALFSQDLEPYANAVKSKVKSDISQHQFDALVILTFNIGVSGFEKSAVLTLVNDSSARTMYKGLELAWKAWNKSQGKVMGGLMKRRNAEWDIYSKNVYKKW